LYGNTITNEGAISVSAVQTGVDYEARAFGIQTGYEGTDNIIINNGLIEVYAEAVSGGSACGSSPYARAVGIQMGHEGQGEVINNGIIDVSAYNETGYARSIGVKVSHYPEIDVTNTGNILSRAVSDTGSALSQGIKYSGGGTIINEGLISVGAEADGHTVAKGIQLGWDDPPDYKKEFTIDNYGEIEAFALSHNGMSVAMGIQIGEDDTPVADAGDSVVTNYGSILAEAEGSDYTVAFGIQGGRGPDTVVNSGLIETYVYSEGEDDTSSIVGKSFGIFTGDLGDSITNSGTVESSITVSTGSLSDESVAAAIRAGCADNWDNPNVIINETGGVLSAFGNWDFADSNYNRSAAHAVWTGNYSDITNRGLMEAGGSITSGDHLGTQSGFFGIKGANDGFMFRNYGTVDVSGDVKAGDYIDYNAGVYGIRASEYSSIDNQGVIDISGALTAGGNIDYNSGVYGIRVGSSESAIPLGFMVLEVDPTPPPADSGITNAGVITVSGDLTAGGNIAYNSGVFGIRAGEYAIIDNTGSVGAVGELTAGGVIGRTAGVYGIRTGYDSEIANEGTVDVSGSLSSEAGIRKHAGVYGIRGGYDSVLANSGAITVAGELTAGENFSMHTGVYGMRTCSGSTVTNTGTIDVTGTLTSGDPTDCNNGVVYGIRTGYGSTVVNTGEINAVLTDDSNTGYSAGIWMREDNNTIHQSGIINASGGEQSAAVIFGCPDSGFAVVNNTLNVMNGAQMTGDMLNLSKRSVDDPSIATVNFGLAADGDGVAVPGTPDAGFSFTYDGSIWGFNDIDDSGEIDVGEENYWTVNAVGGETFLNGETNWFNDVDVSTDAVLEVGSGFTAAGNAVNSGTLYLGGNMAVSTVAGDYTNNAGATLAVGMGSGASDSLTVGGTATIDGGTVLVVPVDIIQDGESHTVLTAGTLAGAGFDEATADSTVLSFTIDDVSVANSLILDTHRQSYEAALAGSGLTSNQSAVSAYLMNLIDTGAAGSLADVILILDTLPTAAALSDAINQMSPESFTAGAAMSGLSRAGFTSNINSRLGALRAIASNRITGAGPALAAVPATRQSGWSPWVRGSYIKADQDGDINYRGYNYDSTGLNVGLDKAVSDRLTMGVTLGLGRASAETSDRRGEINGDSSQFGIYGTWNESAFYVDGSLMYAVNDYLSYRHLPTFGLTARGDYRGRDYAMYVGGGYTMVMGTWNVIPTASLQYGYHREEGFTETGAGGLNLAVDTSSADSLVSKLGFRVNRLFRVSKDVGITPEMSLQWGHEFGDRDQQVTARFAGAPGAFTVSGVTAKRDSAFLGVGVTTTVQESLSLFVSYEGEYRSDFDAHNWQAGLRFEF